MALYIITAVHLRDDGEVSAVRWARAGSVTDTFRDGTHEADVKHVLQAFDHGDIVEMRFETPQGTISGGQLLRKVLADGFQTLREDRRGFGRTLRDLPRF